MECYNDADNNKEDNKDRDHMMGVERESERSLAGNWVSHGRPGFHDCHDYHQDCYDFHFNDYLDGFHHESSILSI